MNFPSAVNLTLSVTATTEDTATIVVNINCLNLPDYDVLEISNLYLKAAPDSDQTEYKLLQFSALCFLESIEVNLTELESSTRYELSVTWLSRNNDTSCRVVDNGDYLITC